eukprot:gb/GECG01015073.1/.p1 GENE.gb/GECG01015073.1/~~gb/GECG01015073.1/.p1  ORF type:complete len:298 (+),score=47.12 gb/GECG01015073.1/:1-894(+)
MVRTRKGTQLGGSPPGEAPAGTATADYTTSPQTVTSEKRQQKRQSKTNRSVKIQEQAESKEEASESEQPHSTSRPKSSKRGHGDSISNNRHDQEGRSEEELLDDSGGEGDAPEEVSVSTARSQFRQQVKDQRRATQVSRSAKRKRTRKNVSQQETTQPEETRATEEGNHEELSQSAIEHGGSEPDARNYSEDEGELPLDVLQAAESHIYTQHENQRSHQVFGEEYNEKQTGVSEQRKPIHAKNKYVIIPYNEGRGLFTYDGRNVHIQTWSINRSRRRGKGRTSGKAIYCISVLCKCP